MTDEFKERLLKWITANYTVEDGNNIPQYTASVEIVNNLYNELAPIIANTQGNINLTGFVQSYSENSSGTSISLIYGYSTNSRHNNWYGWIALIDENFNLIQLIDEFDSGVTLGMIDFLSIDVDGNLYAIERMYEEPTKMRLLTLNNVTLKLPNTVDYSLKIRTSYQIATSTNNQWDRLYTYAIKHPLKNTFLLGGVDYENSPAIIATELVDNGTSGNSFTYYKSTINGQIKDVWASWDSNDVVDFRLLGIDYDNNVLILDKNNTSLSYQTYTLPTEDTGSIDKVDVKLSNKNNIYASCFNILNDQTKRVYYVYRYLNNQFNIIYAKDGDYKDYDRNDTSAIKIIVANNEIYFYSIMYILNSTLFNIEFGRILANNVYPAQINSVDINGQYGFSFFGVTKQFNLYRFYIQAQNNNYQSTQIFNSNNFNGISYQGLESMIPNSVNLYDDNNNIIFARNLYNKVINGNITISTVEVPNTYINNIQIKNKELISSTNSLLVTDSVLLNKNIYEELFINFINTITIKNNNNPNNSIINSIGSARLNNSVSNLADYDNAKITKYRVNYANGTNEIVNIDPSNFFINSQATYGNYILTIYVPVDYKINTIEFISNDEQTSYQTIDCSSLENGKFYSLNQKLEVV